MRIKSPTVHTEDRLALRFISGPGVSIDVNDDPSADEAEVTIGLAGAIGSSFYVDAENGDDANNGLSWANAFATVQAGVDACTSGAHDVVYVNAGGYDEAVVVDELDYVTIVGVSLNGYGRPDIGPSTGTSPALSVTESQGFVAANCRFYSDGVDINVVTNEGNGFVFSGCVFDGDAAQAATKALLLLCGDADDDSYTASEGVIRDCLFRAGDGYGIAVKPADPPGNGVGSTHLLVERCRFTGNVAEDIISLETVGAAYALKDSLFRDCEFMSKNKATHIDIETNHGAANTGNVFRSCYVFDDTINTTAIKAASTGSGFIGCYSLDGLIDGDALD